MNPYPKLLSDLGYGDVVQRLAGGDIPGPIAIDHVGELHEDRAYPPCFLPLLEDLGTGPSYTGIVKHWFVDRESVFARCVVEYGYSVWEIARSEQQLVTELFKKAFDFGTPGEEESASDELLEAAETLGITDPSQIFSLWNEHEDGLYERLPLFTEDPPVTLHWIRDFSYRGEWPHRNTAPENLTRYCGVEVDKELLAARSLPDSEIPDWLKNGDQSLRFGPAFAAQDYRKCWLIANSRGWQWSALREAVDQLVSVSDDQIFAECMKAWQGVDHECWGPTF